jgi:uncharacterized membrane protein YdjX (TVP38/TMEM64 family)
MAKIDTNTVQAPMVAMTHSEVTAEDEPSMEEPLEQRPIREILIGAIGFLAFMTAMVVGMNVIGEDNLRQMMKDAGPLAPLIYIFLKTITYIFAPLTSGPIQIIAAPLFGNVWLGTLYTVAGEVLGGSISFWIARRLGRPVVVRFVGKQGMGQVEKFYQKRMGGWVSLAVARLVLFSVWDFLSYAAGLAKSVHFSTYFLISTFVGAIPTFFFVWIGSEAIQDTRTLLLIYGIVAVLTLIPIVARNQLAALLTWASRSKATKD